MAQTTRIPLQQLLFADVFEPENDTPALNSIIEELYRLGTAHDAEIVVINTTITPSSTVVSETNFGQASSAGTGTTYSRGNHTHGTPASPSSHTHDGAGTSSTIIGGENEAGASVPVASGTRSFAGGDYAQATNLQAVAIGPGSSAANSARVSGASAVGIGFDTNVTGASGISILGEVLANAGVSFGQDSLIDILGTEGASIGYTTYVNSRAGFAAGSYATVDTNAEGGIAIGGGRLGSGQHALVSGGISAKAGIAVGGNALNISGSFGANVGADGGVAIAGGIDATYRGAVIDSGGLRGIALGQNTIVDHADSVALATGAVTTAASQIRLGTATHDVSIPGDAVIELYGATKTVMVEDEGVEAGAVGRVNFAGAGVSAAVVGNEATITIPGVTGAPTDADYLVGTTNAGLSNEIVVGTTPGGELGGTWAAPTVDATHSGSTHSAATDTHLADATDAHDASAISVDSTTLVGVGIDVQAVFEEMDNDIAALKTVDYLVGTATGTLSGEIVTGTAPGGELGGTWAAPTVDATHSGSAHHAQSHANSDHTWFKTAHKTADESVTSSTTLQDDDHLSLTVGTSETWAFECYLVVVGVSATADIKTAFQESLGGSFTRLYWSAHPSWSAAASTFVTSDVTTAVGTAQSFGVSTSERGILLKGVVSTGTSTTLKLQWAQNTSEANAVTIKTGSWIRAQRLA